MGVLLLLGVSDAVSEDADVIGALKPKMMTEPSTAKIKLDKITLSKLNALYVGPRCCAITE